MKPSEATILLTRISAADNREVTEAGALHWAECLPDVTLTDALEWLPRYYRLAHRDARSTWLQPGDVILGVRALFRERRSALFDATHTDALTRLAGREDDDEIIRVGGIDMAARREALLAVRTWQETNPMPGSEVADQMQGEVEQYERVSQRLDQRRSDPLSSARL